MKMNVVLITSEGYPFKFSAGNSKAEFIARGLKENGCRVVIVDTALGTKGQMNMQEGISSNGINYYILPRKNKWTVIFPSATSTLRMHSLMAGTSTSPGKSGLRCQNSQPSSPAYKTYTAATAPVLAMRSARRAAGRARNQPSIALYCSVFMRPPLPCFSFQHTTRCQACQIRAGGDIIELGI